MSRGSAGELDGGLCLQPDCDLLSVALSLTNSLLFKQTAGNKGWNKKKN